MSLVEIKVDLNRVADALEKIQFLLEKLVFAPVPDTRDFRQSTLDDLHIVSEEDHQRVIEEQAAFAERYRVVPGSPAMAQALMDWEAEQRHVYGEKWQAPNDWRTILAEAERSGGRAGTTSAAAPGERG